MSWKIGIWCKNMPTLWRRIFCRLWIVIKDFDILNGGQQSWLLTSWLARTFKGLSGKCILVGFWHFWHLHPWIVENEIRRFFANSFLCNSLYATLKASSLMKCDRCHFMAPLPQLNILHYVHQLLLKYFNFAQNEETRPKNLLKLFCKWYLMFGRLYLFGNHSFEWMNMIKDFNNFVWLSCWKLFHVFKWNGPLEI